MSGHLVHKPNCVLSTPKMLRFLAITMTKKLITKVGHVGVVAWCVVMVDGEVSTVTTA